MRLFAVTLFVALVTAHAQEWPQWRGPNRDGVVTGLAEPKAWPATLKTKWKVTIGEGHSSPVVSAGRVYTHSRQEGNEVVASLDLATGKILWQQKYPAAYHAIPPAQRHGDGPKSTPLIYQGKLYTLGISGTLSCFDLATGKPLWRKTFSDEFKVTWPMFGTAMSPLGDDGAVIAHVGGPDHGALTAFYAATGEVKWRWTGDGPAYASPIIVNLGGTRQIVTQSQQNIVGLSVATGQLLWQIPFTTEYVQNIVTPLVYRDLLIFSGINKGVFAVRVSQQGGKWTTQEVWRNDAVPMYMNSPVADGDLIYGFGHRNKGQFFCLDARTGKTLWTTDGRGGDNAAIVHSGSLLFLLTDDANLIVARKNPKAYEEIRRYRVAESPTWAHPVVLGRQILIKDLHTLALWSLD